MLIEARDLINEINIVQTNDATVVEYFHIELDTHDVIVANGALSDTFLDDASRGMFHNVQEYYALYPESGGASIFYCAPRCADGFAVEAARRKIAQRVGLRPRDDSAGELRGHVDLISPTQIAG